jgi:uncharacterized repeat protein (TIGR01451 family)
MKGTTAVPPGQGLRSRLCGPGPGTKFRPRLRTAGILTVLLQVLAAPAWAETVTLTPPYAESSTFRETNCGARCIAEATADHTTGELSFTVAATPDVFNTSYATAEGTIVGTHTLEAESNAIDYSVNFHITDLAFSDTRVASLRVEADHAACSGCRGGATVSLFREVAEDVTLSFTLTNQDGGPIPQGTIRIRATFGGGVYVRPRNDCFPFICLPESGSGRATVTSIVAEIPDRADLALIKAGPPGRVPTGSNMTYTLTVPNNGPNPASGVTVTDQLPSSVTFVSATPSQGSCSESGGVVTCNLGTMGNGATATVDIVVQPTVAGTVTNTASVTSSTEDPNEANNADSENTSVCRITSRRSSIPCG